MLGLAIILDRSGHRGGTPHLHFLQDAWGRVKSILSYCAHAVGGMAKG